MTERHAFIKFLRKHRACDEGIKWAKRHKTPQEAWQKCKYGSYLLWLLAVKHPVQRNLEWKPEYCKGVGGKGCFCAFNDRPDHIREAFPSIPWMRQKVK